MKRLLVGEAYCLTGYGIAGSEQYKISQINGRPILKNFSILFLTPDVCVMIFRFSFFLRDKRDTRDFRDIMNKNSLWRFLLI
ncbi:MAG: hypothetical protein LBL39_05865 [Planctomycetaceae bacterium]|nr:hypothetical protein [Planctomycetaceae bacterium]